MSFPWRAPRYPKRGRGRAPCPHGCGGEICWDYIDQRMFGHSVPECGAFMQATEFARSKAVAETTDTLDVNAKVVRRHRTKVLS